MTTPARTWDPAALVAAADMPLRALARRLGVDPAQLCRPLSDRQADEWACRIGLHPVFVWGTRWWE